MMNPPYNAPLRAPINLALPWYSSDIEGATVITTLLWASSQVIYFSRAQITVLILWRVTFPSLDQRLFRLGLL